MSVLTGLLTLLSCTAYRTYPLLRLETPEGRLEWTGAAQLPGGALVFSAEGDARALYRPAQAGEPEGGLLDRLVLEDGGCGRAGGQNCQDYRAHTALLPEPIRWREQGGRLEIPYDLSDLAPFGPERVLAVTGYTAVGRRTGARRDYLVRSRQRTERLAVLERRAGAWEELDDPWVAELQARLSDWGRGTCQDDMLVEGLAWSPEAERVFIGLRRCNGPAAAVLQYDLGAARRGEAVDLERIAEGISGGQGPEEGVSGLCFRDGRLFALSAWDSWGYASEQVYGGRLHEVAGGALQPIQLAEPFVDRPSALAIRAIRPESDGSGPGLDALILFDPDGAPDTPRRPDATLLRPRTLRPEAGRSVELQRLDALTLPLALGLNGFDFRWYARDHRLSQLALQLTEPQGAPPGSPPAGPPGAWTYAVGGLWQMTVGATAGLISASLPGSPSWAGHNRQAVALTDYGDVPELRLSRWRATLSVVPRERAVRDPSVARLMRDARADFEVRLPLPPGADPEAGVILQGFSIDTSARAARGICLAAMDLGVERQGRELVLRAMLVGGLCNDFDLRGKELRHGRTTDPAGGVSVTLDWALTAGLPASSWSVTVEDRQVPQAGEGTGGTAASRTMDDHMSRAHLHCAGIYPPGSVEVMTLPAPAPPADWVDVATELRGDPSPPAASLHGFAFAFDPSGFAEETSAPRTQADILRRNHYLYRYLLRAFPGAPGSPGLVEGGLSHGIHRRGLMRDAALPTALYLRADLTGFPTDRARLYDIPRDRPDPNLLPEDGFVRRAATVALQRPLQCSPWR